jgi:hypothetical protein
MTLITIRWIINRICGMLAALGLPCLIIWIILISKNKSRASKIWWLILVSFIPAAIIIRLVSSVIFWNINLSEYTSNSQERWEIATLNWWRSQWDQVVVWDWWRAHPSYN